MEDTWKADDDNCVELIRKALDEMQYQHHNEILDWLADRVKKARLGAAVEAMKDGHALQHDESGKGADRWFLWQWCVDGKDDEIIGWGATPAEALSKTK